ncbi:F-box/WD repeat-containing protein 12 [Liparis tanakae]|uniref:F-box/WD repeat-containing protein 12 n=1 Tax=Liparis tanakae TaxID=230148 RepID=A0A4Z2GBC8_9TELE|nr:F-box/WD repeat-containing protein 12 [Liparis tanakae]
MDLHQPHLISDCLIHVFTFLAEEDLMRASAVCKGEVWCSPVQGPLTAMVIDERREVVITADSAGLVKTWRAQSGQEVASFATASPHCTLLQYNVHDDWFLTVGTSQGAVCTLADPTLTQKSSVVVCDSFKVNALLVSPDKRWIAGGTKDANDLSPKVIYTESLTSPSEDEDPLCRSVPVTGCQAAVFIPSQPARLAVIHGGERTNSSVLTVFDVSLEKTKYKSSVQVQQVASFPLTLNRRASHVLLRAKDSGCLVLAAGAELWVYSATGALLASFKEHAKPISSSRYHLLGGSHTASRGFTHVACDYSSIVASAEGSDGKDVLKAYSFTS